MLDTKKVSKSICSIESEICFLHGLLAAEERGAIDKQTTNTQSTSASQIADKLEVIASSNGVPFVLFKRINRLCRQLRTL